MGMGRSAYLCSIQLFANGSEENWGSLHTGTGLYNSVAPLVQSLSSETDTEWCSLPTVGVNRWINAHQSICQTCFLLELLEIL